MPYIHEPKAGRASKRQIQKISALINMLTMRAPSYIYQYSIARRWCTVLALFLPVMLLASSGQAETGQTFIRQLRLPHQEVATESDNLVQARLANPLIGSLPKAQVPLGSSISGAPPLRCAPNQLIAQTLSAAHIVECPPASMGINWIQQQQPSPNPSFSNNVVIQIGAGNLSVGGRR
jgi:hypothetical protein